MPSIATIIYCWWHDSEITDCMDYDVFAVLSEYFLILLISATNFQMHWPGIEPIFRCKKISNKHLSQGNAQKFLVLIKALYNEVAGAVVGNIFDTLK